MSEWKEGIRYGHGNKQTVPMEQLEKDFQEGLQQNASQKLPWRTSQPGVPLGTARS